MDIRKICHLMLQRIFPETKSFMSMLKCLNSHFFLNRPKSKVVFLQKKQVVSRFIDFTVGCCHDAADSILDVIVKK